MLRFLYKENDDKKKITGRFFYDKKYPYQIQLKLETKISMFFNTHGMWGSPFGSCSGCKNLNCFWFALAFRRFCAFSRHYKII